MSSARFWTCFVGAGLIAALCATGCGEGDEPPREGYLPGGEGAEIHYRVLGSGTDTAVMIHGGPGAGIESVLPDWLPLAEHLVIIFYDQRGGGRSTLPADTSLLHARYFVDDLEAVRRYFGLGRLKLVTHSFGAVLAARYAQRYPERVERMVFHGATGPRRVEAARLARESPPSPDTALSSRMNELLGSLLRGTGEDPVGTCEEYEALGQRLAELRGEPTAWRGTTCAAPPEAVRYYYRYTAQLAPRSFGDWDFTTGLQDLDAPLLVIHGARDSAALPQQRAWADAVPQGRLLLVEDAGKGAVAERPDVVLPAVVSFLIGDRPRGDERGPLTLVGAVGRFRGNASHRFINTPQPESRGVSAETPLSATRRSVRAGSRSPPRPASPGASRPGAGGSACAPPPR